MFIFNNFSTCFEHQYAHLQENKTYVLKRVIGEEIDGGVSGVQHTTCSNIRLVLLKMGIMMPETC